MIDLQEYINLLKLNPETIWARALYKNENGYRTAAKEMIGEKIIQKFHLFDILFPENIGFKKITDKKRQKAGADYIIYYPNNEYYIDLKVCFGPSYTMKMEDYLKPTRIIGYQPAIPVEIYQNDIFTNNSCKITDYMLYLIIDENGLRAYLIDYNVIRKISKEHKGEIKVENNVAKKVQTGTFKWYTSNNGSGIYIKIPAEKYFIKKVENI